MPRTRRRYPPEFRQQLIDLARAARPPEQLAKEFEPRAQTIRNWVTQAARDTGERHCRRGRARTHSGDTPRQPRTRERPRRDTPEQDEFERMVADRQATAARKTVP